MANKNIFYTLVMAVSIISLNVNGLNNNTKLHTTLNSLQNTAADFFFLQETHLSNKNISKVSSQWPGTTFHAPGRSHTAGVAILAKEKNFKTIALETDDGGRYILLGCEIDQQKFLLCNLYAPSGAARVKQIQRKFFFEKLLKLITPYMLKNFHLIVGGDFNTTISSIDRSIQSTPAYRCMSNSSLINLIHQLHLADPWRETHTTVEEFTHEGSVGRAWTRIDRIYTSQTLLPIISLISHEPNIFSDHYNQVHLKIVCTDTHRGKGSWVFNNSLLSDDIYTTKLKTLWEEWTTHIDAYPDIGDWWENGKSKIKAFSITFSKKKSHQKHKQKNSLTKRLRNLNKKLPTNPDKYTPIANNLKNQLRQYEEQEAEGAKVRNKIKWRLEGEKCSKFFLNLEKQQKSKQNLNKLKISNSQVTTDPEIILKEVRSFYKTLYSKQKPNERAINHIFVGTNKTISQKSKTQCEDTLTEENLRKALFDMESNKSPGTDGLTAEFYKHFWDLIGPHLLKVIHSCLQNKQLTHSQQEAVISCLYKKGPREQISNWRPISLLNIDYKILTKSLANKLISTLSEVISEDQTASVTGRSILTNLNLTRDIIQYAWDKKIPASIISIDQVKAFDRVDWDFLFQVLKKFGYGQQFITNIKTIYTNIQSKIKINGCMSEPFFLERGVRQGCPLSMPLYVLCAEILANYIRTRTQIKGVQINRHECKLTQFADDTNLFLVGQKSIDHLEDALQLYEEASGAQINIDKCEGMWLGSYIDNTSKPLGYKWRNDKIKVLRGSLL